MRSYDVLCALPVFLDVTLLGLEKIPRPGEERFARSLHLNAGGGGNVALGAARLGLRTALAWPVARDLVGDHLRVLLSAEGVEWHGPPADAAAVSVIMPIDGDRAMATHAPGGDAVASLAGLHAHAVVIGLDDVARLPAGPEAVYAVTGDVANRELGGVPRSLERCRALVANEREACALSGEQSAEDAARALARVAPTAVVTLGPAGALAAASGGVARAAAPPVEAVDTTGAGDLFTAAYVWADTLGLPLSERLAWATLYASQSVRVATVPAGALHLAELERAGLELGLTLPRSSPKECA